MDSDFAAEVAAWTDFYAPIAGASATLLGLLFVALALNPTVMRDGGRDGGKNGTRVWAAETFHNFLVVLAIAITALIPDQTPSGVGVPLFLLGAHGVYRVVRDIREARMDPDPLWQDRHVVTRFASPGIAYLLIAWAGGQSMSGDPEALNLLIPAIFLLILSASASCWDLLREIGNSQPGN